MAWPPRIASWRRRRLASAAPGRSPSAGIVGQLCAAPRCSVAEHQMCSRTINNISSRFGGMDQLQRPDQISHLNRSGTGVEWDEPYSTYEEEPQRRGPPLEYAGYRQQVPQGSAHHHHPTAAQIPAPTVSKERRNDPLQRLLHSLELSQYYPLFVKNEVVYSGNRRVC